MDITTKALLVTIGVILLVVVLGFILAKVIVKDVENTRKEHQESRNRGIQSKQETLRASMNKLWEKYSEQGYAPEWIKKDFETLFDQYRKLGSTEDMDDVRDSILSLPNEKQT